MTQEKAACWAVVANCVTQQVAWRPQLSIQLMAEVYRRLTKFKDKCALVTPPPRRASVLSVLGRGTSQGVTARRAA
jgi:hypothetical protein